MASLQAPDASVTPSSPAGIKAVLKSQYHAALAMLHSAIERCPDELWDEPAHRNRSWQIAYHALFFAHFYMCRDEGSFRPWAEHQADCQHPDGIAGPPDPESTLPLVPEPYTKAQVLAYWAICDGMVDAAVDDLDLDRQESGFPWYPIPKLEHQLVNVRHIQHHAAQLAERLRTAADVGIRWAGARRPGTRPNRA